MPNHNGDGIKILPDGPYEVAANIPLVRAIIRNDAGGAAETWEMPGKLDVPDPGSPYLLCRCGHSRDKPFCDGTHNDVGFCGRETNDRTPYAERATRLEGPELGLLDDEPLCVGARFCDRGDTVWKLVEESADPEKRAMAIAEAGACPGGRLTALDKDGTPMEPDLPKEIAVVDDPANMCCGPLWVRGGVPVEDGRGEEYEIRNRVALCRCGESQNQPYCDSTHYSCPHMHTPEG